MKLIMLGLFVLLLAGCAVVPLDCYYYGCNNPAPGYGPPPPGYYHRGPGPYYYGPGPYWRGPDGYRPR